MTRQEKEFAITAKLPELPDEMLTSLFNWIILEDDAFESQLRQDVDAGHLDELIAKAIAEDIAGETIDLETSCDEAILATV